MTLVFMARQAQLSAVWALECDTLDGTTAVTADVLERMQELNSTEDGISVLPPALVDIVPAARDSASVIEEEEDYEGPKNFKKKGAVTRRAGESDEAYRLRLEEAKRKYEEYLQKRKLARASLKNASESHYAEKFRCEVHEHMRGSGMLLAHFSYVGGAMAEADLKQHEFFGLRRKQKQPNASSERQSTGGQLDFHDAVCRGLVSIISATGHSFGKQALWLNVQNVGKGQTTVVLASGTIFEHTDWVHKQNLMVINTTTIRLWPKESKQVKVDAHCMNISCSCSNGESMYLTDFYFDKQAIIAHQSKIWDYFETKFSECRGNQ
jgi:hypothetical protein